MHYVRVQLGKRHYYSPKLDTARLAYHKYGLKYLALLLTLTGYSFIGAGIFLFFEKPAELERVSRRERMFEGLKQNLVRRMVDDFFNDTQRPLIFVEASRIDAISGAFMKGLRTLEDVIEEYNSKHGIEPMLRWDIWTSLIYAWTVITTIGYGHLFPLTTGGRIATMLYAIVGIPLMLTALSNVGKLLTKGMKYPFFIMKRLGRRMFRYCTKMTKEQILEADQKDKSTLEVFDLPIPVAIMLVIGWIFFCSAITLIWEEDWDYLVAFYFFFISLSTIGFGDVVPSKPYYLLVMFGNTLIGMALVSMLLNLIQGKLEPIAMDDEEQDPFDKERNRLRRAFRGASIFSNVGWMEKGGGSRQNGLDRNSNPLEASSSADTAHMKKRRKSKQAAGGAAMSALSTFLVPIFSAASAQEKMTDEQNRLESPKGPDEKKDSPVNGEVVDVEVKNTTSKENLRLKPLEKTVSFQENELEIMGEQSEQAGMGLQSPPPAPHRREVPIRALLVSEETEDRSARIRRTEPVRGHEWKSERKKRRKRSMRGQKLSKSVDTVVTGDKERGHHRVKQRHSPYHSNQASTEFATPQRKPKDSPRKMSQMSFSTPDQSSPAAVQWKNRRKRLHKASSAQVNVVPALQESHSGCSICSYQPLASQASDHVMMEGAAGKWSDHVMVEGVSRISTDQVDDHWRFDEGIGEQTLIIEIDGQAGDVDSNILRHRPPLIHRSFSRQCAVWSPVDDRSLDTVNRGSSIDNRLKNTRLESPWYRHSIDIVEEPRRHFGRLLESHSDHDHLYGTMKECESQTMISFPSQDSDSRISINGERGTTRLLPESASFTEINRLVNLNINVEMLRNELAALALAAGTGGNLEDYQLVLTPQEMIEQISHEAALPLAVYDYCAA